MSMWWLLVQVLMLLVLFSLMLKVQVKVSGILMMVFWLLCCMFSVMGVFLIISGFSSMVVWCLVLVFCGIGLLVIEIRKLFCWMLVWVVLLLGSMLVICRWLLQFRLCVVFVYLMGKEQWFLVVKFSRLWVLLWQSWVLLVNSGVVMWQSWFCCVISLCNCVCWGLLVIGCGVGVVVVIGLDGIVVIGLGFWVVQVVRKVSGVRMVRVFSFCYWGRGDMSMWFFISVCLCC